MSMADTELAAAEARSQAARRRLAGTMFAMQDRINPKTLAREAAQELKEAGTDLARKGLETVRDNPGVVAGVVATLGLILSRHRIGAWLGRGPKGDATSGHPRSLKTKRAKAPRTRKSA